MSAKDTLIAFVQSLPDDMTIPDAVDAIGKRFGSAELYDCSPAQWSVALRAEIRRRVAAIRSGEAAMTPAEDVMRKYRGESFG